MPAWLAALMTRKMLICIFTGFSSGLPLYLLLNLLPAWLRSEGVDLKTIGFFALIQFPYTWKFLWSPLLDRYAIRKPLAIYHEHNAARERPRLLAMLRGGMRLALVSDAGTPLISDPGYKLVEAALAEGLKVIPVPGASAVTVFTGRVKSPSGLFTTRPFAASSAWRFGRTRKATSEAAPPWISTPKSKVISTPASA